MDKNLNKGSVNDNLKSIRITSFNVRGLKNKIKRDRVLHYMKNKYPGILFLQETYTTEGDESSWKKQWDGDIFMSHGTNHSKGVAILIPKEISYISEATVIDSDGRFILIHGTFEGKELSLLNCYAPTCSNPKTQKEFLNTLLPVITKYQENLIWAGDLNVHLNPAMDKKGGKNQTLSQYASQMITVMHEFDFIDIWRVCNADSYRYTWRENTAHGIIQSRLDYFICPNSFLYKLKDCSIQNSVYSDHNPITLELFIENETTRGKGFWKFNNSLLTDCEYVSRVKKILNEYELRYKNLNDYCLIWDTAKAEIRGLTISHATYKARERKQTEIKLNKEMELCEQQLASNPSDNVHQHYTTVKKELEEINNYAARGVYIRAQAQFIEQNELNTKLFLGLERSRAKSKSISKLINDQNEEITDPAEILKLEEKFYQSLYSEKIDHHAAEAIEAKKHFLDQPCEQLRDTDKINLDSNLTDQEISTALKELPSHKSPGGDGFTVDFYKFFWPDIKNLVCKSIKLAVQRGEMSIEQKRAVLTLVPKKDKDVRILKNWRPISLLNTDYKILAKALAIRIQSVIPYIINHDQSGCIKNRSTFGNIRSIYDVINYINENKRDGIITFVDYEKAFDTVSWKFLFDCLKAYNFGDNFINAIKTLYNNVETCVTNNGHSSQFFKPSRGIRQGCPISALLFLLVAETLANAIRRDPNIHGIRIGTNEWKIGQYADDTSLFLNDEHSLSLALKTIDKFSKCSGLRMNRDKTEAIHIGESSNFIHKGDKIKWTNNNVKCLGVYINKNNRIATQANIMEKLGKIESLIKIWKCRSLTLKGKVTIVNSLLVSQMLYIASVIHIPKWAITKYNNLIRNFIWDDKPPKIKYTTLIAPIEKGGLKLQDLESKIKANKLTWIKRIAETKIKKPWKDYLQSKLKFPIQYIPRHNKRTYNHGSLNDNFYIEMLDTWATLNYNEPTNISEILRQPLWDNDLILIDKKTSRNDAWSKVGITHIANLINANGHLATINQLNNKFQVNIKTLEHNSIMHSIPKEWKKQIKQNKGIAGTQIAENASIKIDQTYYDIEEVTTKQIYTHVIENKCKSPTSKKRWIELYEDMDLDLEYWELIYETPFLLTKNTKVLNTQYKIINRILAVGCNLKKWKITTNDECKDCKSKDTIEHFISECPTTKQLWKSIQNWWKNLFLFAIKISSLEIIFGLPNENKDSMIHVYNFVILYAKHYIYTNKKMSKPLSLYEFLLQLKYELKLKKEYAKQQQKVHKFNITWGQLYDNL
jgi:exonuclease III